MKSKRQAPKAAPGRDGGRRRGAAVMRDDERRRRADGRPAGRRPVEAPSRENRPKNARCRARPASSARCGPVRLPLRPPPRFRAGPSEEHQPGQGARQGTEGQGAQGRSPPTAGADAVRLCLRDRVNPRTLLARVPFVVLVIAPWDWGWA